MCGTCGDRTVAYRLLFRDLRDSLGVGGEDNIEMDLQEVQWGDLDWVDLAEDRDR